MRTVSMFSWKRDVALHPASRRPAWPWALGTLIVVAGVLLGALGAHHIVAGRRAAANVVRAPAVPAAMVTGATPPTMYAQVAALDAPAGHLVALTSATRPQCPPASACPPAPALSAFAVFDAATGQPLTTIPLTSAAAAASESVLLLADPTRHIAYAVAPGAVTRFSTTTGAFASGYALSVTAWQRESGGGLDVRRDVLVLGGGDQLLALDAASGRPLASRMLDAGTTISGLTLDPTSGTVYALLHRLGAAQPALAAYDETTLAPTSRVPLPAGARLGPLDTSLGTVYLPGAANGQCAYSLHDTQLISAATGVCDALALGWDSVTGHLYTSNAAGLTLRDSMTGRAFAALPVRAAWTGDEPLLVDEGHATLYIPDERGTILIVRDGPQPAALMSGSALLLARAALADLLPDTNQDPPFVSPETFPAAPGKQPQAYWIHFSDLGWQGPYPGDAASAVRPLPDGAGGYAVTFTITWNQLFRRTHSWVCDVAPDGSVRLASETGDAVP